MSVYGQRLTSGGGEWNEAILSLLYVVKTERAMFFYVRKFNTFRVRKIKMHKLSNNALFAKNGANIFWVTFF